MQLTITHFSYHPPKIGCTYKISSYLTATVVKILETTGLNTKVEVELNLDEMTPNIGDEE